MFFLFLLGTGFRDLEFHCCNVSTLLWSPISAGSLFSDSKSKFQSAPSTPYSLYPSFLNLLAIHQFLISVPSAFPLTAPTFPLFLIEACSFCYFLLWFHGRVFERVFGVFVLRSCRNCSNCWNHVSAFAKDRYSDTTPPKHRIHASPDYKPLFIYLDHHHTSRAGYFSILCPF